VQPSGQFHPSTKIGLQHVLIVILASFAMLHGWVLWRTHDFILRGYGDFASFYAAGKIVLRGEGARLYDRHLQWQIQQEFAASVSIRKGPLPYIRPPFEALLFVPFALIGYPAAVVVWTFTKLILLIATFFLMPQESWQNCRGLRSPFLQGILAIGFLPVAFDLVQGQDSIPLLLLITAALFFLRKEADLRSGACLALGLFKFHLILPLFVILLVKRRTRVVCGFLCVALGLLLVSMGVVGWSGIVHYPKYLWELNQAPMLLGTNGLVMPNIRGLLSPFLGARRVPFAIQAALLLVFALAIVSMAKMWTGKGKSRLDQAGFSYCIAVMLLTSYYTTSYDLTLLLLSLHLTGGILASDFTLRGWPRSTFAVSAGVLLLSPLYWVFGVPMVDFYWMALVLLVLTASHAGVVVILQGGTA
jgi:hypothetical protein